MTRDLAYRMREAREEQRLTRNDLSNMSGVAARSIEAYERGDAVPSVLAVRAIANALGVSLDDLVPGGAS